MRINSIKKDADYSEPVQEIMGTIPLWITRWGVIIIAAVFALIVIGCCIVKYPQTVTSTISIISTAPPSQLEARYTGIIDTIAVKNGQTVKQGDLIALLKTPAVYKDVLRVKSFSEVARSRSLSECIGLPILESQLSLGSLQDKWTELLSLSKEYQQYRNLDQIEKKRSLLADQIRKNKEYFDAMVVQRSLIERDTKLQKLAMQRDSVLWDEGLSAQAEYEASQQAYISKLNSLASFDASLKSARLNSLALEQGLNELEIQRLAEEDAFNLRFSRTMSELQAQMASWLETYTITAPFDGTVSLHDFWGIGQHVNTNDVLASVVPDVEADVEGRMKVSSVGFGRIERGQTVNVRLNGFPYIEFGIIKGEISRISQVPEKTPDGSVAYNVEVSFPHGLVSTYHKTFPFIQDMDGEAEIITQDQRLIEHFIEPIFSLFRNR